MGLEMNLQKTPNTSPSDIQVTIDIEKVFSDTTFGLETEKSGIVDKHQNWANIGSICKTWVNP